MFIVLPSTVFFLIFLYRMGARDDVESQDRPWQGEFLITAAVWGALLVAITEGLSLFSAINRQWLAISWSIVLVVVLVISWRSGRFNLGWQCIRRGFPLKSRLEYLYLGIFVGIASLLFLVAFVSPPSNVDALQYHMPRAVHWAQNQSLGHYPAAHLGQNVRPYWAEAAILNLRVLWGNDHPANLVQWFSMIGSVIAITGIAAVLDDKRRTQWLTAAFAISIPMGVLQAVTTQNDYVSAFWVVCLAYFVVLSKRREITKVELLGLSLSLGLGMLTKGTFFPFAGPLMVWFFVPRIFKASFKKTVAEIVVIGFIAASLNATFWSRNIMTFGGPYGSSLPIKVFERSFETPQDGFALREQTDILIRSDESNHPEIDQYSTSGIKSLLITESLIDADIHGRTSLSGEFRALALKLIRMVVMNFVTPIHWFNTRLFIAMESFPEIFTEGYIKSLEWAAWNHEMTAGNPLHFGLLFLSMIGAGLIEVKRKGKWILQYSIIAIAGYILLTPIDYSDWIFSIRYQITFFVLGAPIFGSVFEKLDKKIVSLFTICLLLYAVPYVLFSNMRPVIGHPPWPTRIDSVFTADSTQILFAQSPEISDEYMLITERIQEEGCGEVGISISRKDLEYTFWWLLEAPQSGIHIRHVEAPPALERYLDPAFTPCAIICTDCQGAQDFHQLPIAIEAGHVQLFLESN